MPGVGLQKLRNRNGDHRCLNTVTADIEHVQRPVVIVQLNHIKYIAAGVLAGLKFPGNRKVCG